MPTKTTKKTAAAKSGSTTAAATRRPAASKGRARKPATSVETSAVAVTPESASGEVWTRIDLHTHTPGSHDYEQPDKTYLDILRQAERRGLKMIAFTDHNTVNGYRSMMREIELLDLLEKSERIRPDELARLLEYRRLLKKIVVLPGFEFTATFGFHILGIFPPNKPLRDIDHVLLQLKVPGDVLDKGLTEAGATSDVLTAYQLIDAAGGIAIAAHANSSNGVSMRNMNLGGQTRIAFTQDSHLLAIEFTDLDKGPRRSSAYLFSGVKPEYPRRMFAIQGSDAHRVVGDPSNPKRLGVGDRPTEVLLTDVSFKGLRDLFLSNAFDRVRPVFDRLELPPDMSDLNSARDAGASATVAFYPALAKKGDRLDAVLQDICAMSNGDGGVIFIGCGDKSAKKTAGLSDARKVATEISQRLEQITPQAHASVGEIQVDNKPVLRIMVSAGKNAPYTLPESRFYVRRNTETGLANRDEIVALAKRTFEAQRPQQAAPQHQPRREQHQPRREQQQPQPSQQQPRLEQASGQPQAGNQQPRPSQQGNQQLGNQQPRRNEQRPQQAHPNQRQPQQQGNSRNSHPNRNDQGGNSGNRQPQSNVGSLQLPRSLQGAALQGNGRNGRGGKPAEPKIPETPVDPIPSGAPKTGVQVLSMDERSGAIYFTVRDLRNNLVVRNVTMKSARDLWHYAISQYADHPGGPEEIDWNGDRAVLAGGVRAGKMRYDLALRDEKGSTHVFYGVMQDGLDENWKDMIAAFDANNGAAQDDTEELEA
jgi:hypothetical protein